MPADVGVRVAAGTGVDGVCVDAADVAAVPYDPCLCGIAGVVTDRAEALVLAAVADTPLPNASNRFKAAILAAVRGSCGSAGAGEPGDDGCSSSAWSVRWDRGCLGRAEGNSTLGGGRSDGCVVGPAPGVAGPADGDDDGGTPCCGRPDRPPAVVESGAMRLTSSCSLSSDGFGGGAWASLTGGGC